MFKSILLDLLGLDVCFPLTSACGAEMWVSQWPYRPGPQSGRNSEWLLIQADPQAPQSASFCLADRCLMRKIDKD